MQYEVWGRSRETKVYEFIDSFTNINDKYSKLDLVDIDVYYEAMIVRTDYNELPRLEMYLELDKLPEKQKIKRKENNYESIRKY